MKICPITYEPTSRRYSEEGIRLLSPRLKGLNDFAYSAEEQRRVATLCADKLSIQGVQPKLSTRLNVPKQQFEIVETGGTFIFKPPHHLYAEVPENEDLTMRLASLCGIQVPLHGLIHNDDGSRTYFIKRFDRFSRNKKCAVEDLSQLGGHSRATKYASSMERLVSVLERYCTFPAIEKLKLLRLVCFSWLTGNEDMHLKNFSLITRDGMTGLSPAYDLLNTTIIIKTQEELALPLKGKKRNLTVNDFLKYYGQERLQLQPGVIDELVQQFFSSKPSWQALIERSLLSNQMKEVYWALLESRLAKLETWGDLGNMGATKS